MTKERYPLGLIAGLCGGLAATVINLVMILWFKYGEVRFMDFAGVFILGHLPRDFSEDLLAFFAFLGFAATMGVVFTHGISIPPKPYLLLKAVHFGLGIWFFSYALTLLFKVPELERISLSSAITNLLASMAYGLGMGLVLQWRLKRIPVSSRK
ncbi:MAG TPA: hypothetical protein DD734_08130 [Firmicutes bacterium]|nr:hypothetical protein [Bacillota bacterium]